MANDIILFSMQVTLSTPCHSLTCIYYIVYICTCTSKYHVRLKLTCIPCIPRSCHQMTYICTINRNHTFRTVPNYNRKIIETVAKLIPCTYIYIYIYTCPHTVLASIICGRINLFQ